MPSTYWLLSCPLLGSKEDTWKLLHDKLTHAAFDTPVYKVRGVGRSAVPPFPLLRTECMLTHL